jgi:hypothetical protein
MSNKYDVKHFGVLFEEIGYAYESRYPPHKHTHDDFEEIVFYKLYLRSDGTGQYKAHCFTFNPEWWPKVVTIYDLLNEE